MNKIRLEAFSDAVVAIVITIMVLELRVPLGTDWPALRPVVSTLLLYALSFVILGIYWANHHHMLYLADRINGSILWANLHLLFWLTLLPFSTRWMGQSQFAPLATAAYGVVMLCAAVAFQILQKTIVAYQGPASKLRAAVGMGAKEKISTVAFVAAIPLAFISPWISVALYVSTALLWLVPDRRIESKVP